MVFTWLGSRDYGVPIISEMAKTTDFTFLYPYQALNTGWLWLHTKYITLEMTD